MRDAAADVTPGISRIRSSRSAVARMPASPRYPPRRMSTCTTSTLAALNPASIVPPRAAARRNSPAATSSSSAIATCAQPATAASTRDGDRASPWRRGASAPARTASTAAPAPGRTRPLSRGQQQAKRSRAIDAESTSSGTGIRLKGIQEPNRRERCRDAHGGRNQRQRESFREQLRDHAGAAGANGQASPLHAGARSRGRAACRPRCCTQSAVPSTVKAPSSAMNPLTGRAPVPGCAKMARPRWSIDPGARRRAP